MSKQIILDDDWKEDGDENEEEQQPEDSRDVETVVLATYYDIWMAESTVTLLAQHKIPSFIANAPSSSVWGSVTNSPVRVHIAKADYVAAQKILKSVGDLVEPMEESEEEDYEEEVIVEEDVATQPTPIKNNTIRKVSRYGDNYDRGEGQVSDINYPALIAILLIGGLLIWYFIWGKT